MTYLLDTSAAVAIIRGKPAGVRARLASALQSGDRVVISTIVAYELWYGVSKSARREENAELLQTFFSGNVDLIPFESDAAALAGDVRAALEKSGNMIGPYDLMIAAHALSLQATLITANVSEFSRVNGLAWEDWTE